MLGTALPRRAEVLATQARGGPLLSVRPACGPLAQPPGAPPGARTERCWCYSVWRRATGPWPNRTEGVLPGLPRGDAQGPSMGNTFSTLSDPGLIWNAAAEVTVGLPSGRLPLLLHLLGVPRKVPAPGGLQLPPQNPASVVPKMLSLLLPELRAQWCCVRFLSALAVVSCVPFCH